MSVVGYVCKILQGEFGSLDACDVTEKFSEIVLILQRCSVKSYRQELKKNVF